MEAKKIGAGGISRRKLRQETDRDSLIKALAAEYGLATEQVTGDVDAFLSELDACHLLVR